MSWEIKAGRDADKKDDNDSSSNYKRFFHRRPLIKINTLLCRCSLCQGLGSFVYTSTRSCRHFQNACDYSVIVLPMMRYRIHQAGTIDCYMVLLKTVWQTWTHSSCAPREFWCSWWFKRTNWFCSPCLFGTFVHSFLWESHIENT